MNCQYTIFTIPKYETNLKKAGMTHIENKYLFYVTLFVFFVLDFMFFAFFEQQLFFFVLCLFWAHICHAQKITATQSILSLLLLSLESFFYCGTLEIQLLYLVPLTFFGIHSRQWLSASLYLPHILLTIYLLLNGLTSNALIGFLGIIGPYTFVKIIANIIVMIGISLIFYSQGKLGNRLNTVYWFQEESPDSQ